MDFSQIIKEQREELEEIEQRERIIGREGLEKTKEFLKYPNILAVMGVRRCGKSIFSYLFANRLRRTKRVIITGSNYNSFCSS